MLLIVRDRSRWRDMVGLLVGLRWLELVLFTEWRRWFCGVANHGSMTCEPDSLSRTTVWQHLSLTSRSRQSRADHCWALSREAEARRALLPPFTSVRHHIFAPLERSCELRLAGSAFIARHRLSAATGLAASRCRMSYSPACMADIALVHDIHQLVPILPQSHQSTSNS